LCALIRLVISVTTMSSSTAVTVIAIELITVRSKYAPRLQ
jgi:hypothetical protein